MRTCTPLLVVTIACADGASPRMSSAPAASDEAMPPAAPPSAVPAPEPLWYEHAEPSRPACRTAPFFGSRLATAAACHWLLRHAGRPDCEDDLERGMTTCGRDEVLEWFAETSSANVFVGGDFSAIVEVQGSAFRLTFDSGERASCSVTYGSITLCISGDPERR